MRRTLLHIWLGRNWHGSEKAAFERFVDGSNALIVADILWADVIVVNEYKELEEMERDLPEGVPCLYTEPNDQGHPTWLYCPFFKGFRMIFSLLSQFKRHIEESEAEKASAH